MEDTPPSTQTFRQRCCPLPGGQRQAQLSYGHPSVCYRPLQNSHPQVCDGSGLKESLCLPALRMKGKTCMRKPPHCLYAPRPRGAENGSAALPTGNPPHLRSPNSPGDEEKLCRALYGPRWLVPFSPLVRGDDRGRDSELPASQCPAAARTSLPPTA